MTPLTALIAVEWRRLWARPGARLGLFAAGMLGGLFVALTFALRQSGAVLNGDPIFADATAAWAVGWALWFRNAGLFPGWMALLAVAASAGDLETHVVRDDLMRPIRRRDAVLARFVALLGWSAATTAATLAVAAALGIPAFGLGVGWVGWVRAAALSLLGDALVAAFALAAGFATGRSLGALTALLTGALTCVGAAVLVFVGRLGVSAVGTGNPAFETVLNLAGTVLPQAAWAGWWGAEHAFDPIRGVAAVAWVALGLSAAAMALQRRQLT